MFVWKIFKSNIKCCKNLQNTESHANSMLQHFITFCVFHSVQRTTLTSKEIFNKSICVRNIMISKTGFNAFSWKHFAAFRISSLKLRRPGDYVNILLMCKNHKQRRTIHLIPGFMGCVCVDDFVKYEELVIKCMIFS